MHLIAKLSIYNLNYDIDILFDKLCIIGQSGYGKSTLLKCIHNIIKYQGFISINNKKHYKTMLMNQDSKLFDDTVYNNLIKIQKIFNCIDKDLIYKYLNDLQVSHLINTHVSSLSGGEYQRICIIRTLINKDIDCLLLDEPASALDLQSTIILNNILGQYDKPIIYITHNLNLTFGNIIDISSLLT